MLYVYTYICPRFPEKTKCQYNLKFKKSFVSVIRKTIHLNERNGGKEALNLMERHCKTLGGRVNFYNFSEQNLVIPI